MPATINAPWRWYESLTDASSNYPILVLTSALTAYRVTHEILQRAQLMFPGPLVGTVSHEQLADADIQLQPLVVGHYSDLIQLQMVEHNTRHRPRAQIQDKSGEQKSSSCASCVDTPKAEATRTWLYIAIIVLAFFALYYTH